MSIPYAAPATKFTFVALVSPVNVVASTKVVTNERAVLPTALPVTFIISPAAKFSPVIVIVDDVSSLIIPLTLLTFGGWTLTGCHPDIAST